MVPAGMAFVYFNDTAAERQKQLPYVSSYWECGQRANPEIGTLFLWRPPRITCMVARCAGYDPGRGLGKYFERHETLAKAIWAAVECWGRMAPCA